MSRALLFLQHFPGGAAPGRATGGGAACGMGSPGEAFMPTPGRFTVVRCEKARTFVRALISNMAVRGGLTRFARRYSAHPWASPLRGQRRRCSKTLPAFLSGQPAYCVRGLSNWLRQLSNPGRGFSSPRTENIKEKSPYFRTSSHLEYGGEGGIRTPDTLPYTHFPGVLLQPLGHLTILSFPLLLGTGANVGKYVSPVNQLF